MSTFAPTVVPNISSTFSDTPRVLRAQFGDGYSQRASDGLNYQTREVNLNWDALEEAAFDYINDFFDGLDGGEAFTYTLPMESTAMNWEYISKRVAFRGYNIRSLSVSIKRVFDI